MHPKSPEEIQAMREGGRMLGQVLQHLKQSVVAGMTPKDASRLASVELKRLGGKPAFRGFEGFPDIICISNNNEVQHSIPSDVPFQDGDIVNFDFGVLHKSMVTDAGITICIGGNPDKAGARLLEGTERALYAGLDQVKDGARVGDISEIGRAHV